MDDFYCSEKLLKSRGKEGIEGRPIKGTEEKPISISSVKGRVEEGDGKGGQETRSLREGGAGKEELYSRTGPCRRLEGGGKKK